ncbi:MAG: LCP family protein [Butyrivibrio sp.]|nr:LCP family protein [Butyrivibrio sp.]
MKRKMSVFLFIWAMVATVVAVGLVAFEVFRTFGKSNLDAKSVTSAPMLESGQEESDSATVENTQWESDWVRYNGDIYDYNDDINTFLIMGIDKTEDVVPVAEGTDGGQADGLFLLVLNPHKEQISVIAINRNTMADVDIYDETGNYMTTTKAQIAVQHGFGDGVEESCGYQVKAVSKLFYQLPIHGYAAINMSAIATINDTVGGVDVTVLEDLTNCDEALEKGKQVHLLGDMAYYYVKYRDITKRNSADGRLLRQKQYLQEFIQKARVKSREDSSTALDLYSAIASQMTTDITADELSYLVPLINDYSFSDEDVITIEGSTKRGEEFEEFYVDEDALYQTIIDVFYEKIN